MAEMMICKAGHTLPLEVKTICCDLQCKNYSPNDIGDCINCIPVEPEPTCQHTWQRHCKDTDCDEISCALCGEEYFEAPADLSESYIKQQMTLCEDCLKPRDKCDCGLYHAEPDSRKVEKHCDVHTLSGEYCPNIPTKPYMLEGKPINLCYQCYKNCIDGAFGAGLYLNLKPAEQPTPTEQMPLITINRWNATKGDWEKFATDEAIKQRDADMSWHNEKVQQVRKAFAEKIELKLKQMKLKVSFSSRNMEGWNNAIDSVSEDIRAMAEEK